MESSGDQICIHVGTQTGSILGFQGDLTAMQSIYAYSPNLGSVKCITTNGRYLITGGFDEIIRLYDLKQRREKGNLIGHEGTITCIQSFQNFVLSGSEDATIIIWKMREWSLLFRLKGHKDSIYDMAIHPTGKLLASVGKDRKIILWNLINGTKIFRKTMPFNIYKIKWAPEENVIVMSDNSIYLVSQETNKEIKEWKHPKRINEFLIINEILVVAGDDGNLYFWNNVWDIEQASYFMTFQAHTPRVKKMKLLTVEDKNYLVTCSTDGLISIWEINDLLEQAKNLTASLTLEEKPQPVFSLNSYQRVITLDAHFASQLYAHEINSQIDQPDEEEVEEEEEKVEQAPKKKGKGKGNKGNDQPLKAEKQGKKIKKVHFDEPEAPKQKKSFKKQQVEVKQKIQQKKMNPVQEQPAKMLPNKKKANKK